MASHVTDKVRCGNHRPYNLTENVPGLSFKKGWALSCTFLDISLRERLYQMDRCDIVIYNKNMSFQASASWIFKSEHKYNAYLFLTDLIVKERTSAKDTNW